MIAVATVRFVGGGAVLPTSDEVEPDLMVDLMCEHKTRYDNTNAMAYTIIILQYITIKLLW